MSDGPPSEFDVALSERGEDFDFAALDGEAEQSIGERERMKLEHLNRRQIICALLSLLAAGTDAYGAGQRVFILAHELKLGTCRRKQDLAAKLGVSPGRVSQLLKSLRAQIALLTKGET